MKNLILTWTILNIITLLIIGGIIGTVLTILKK